MSPRRTNPGRWITAGLLGAAFAGATGAQPPVDDDRRLDRAYYLEVGMRDLDAAARLYAEAIDRARSTQDEDMLVRALLGRARCRIERGDAAGAEEDLRAVLAIVPDHAEAERLLPQPTPDSDLDPELRHRVDALVLKLGGPEREAAEEDLLRIGDLALPFVAAGLESRDVGIVGGAARVLVRSGYRNDEALDVLSASFSSEDVLFPYVIAEAIASLVAKSPAYLPRLVGVLAAGLEHADPRTRAQLASTFSKASAASPAAILPLLRRAARDSEAAVRRAVWGAHVDPSVRAELIHEMRVALLEGTDAERAEVLDWLEHMSARPELREGLSVALREMVQSTDPGVRRTALRRARILQGFGGWIDPSEFAALAAAGLRDAHADVQEVVPELLAGFQAPWSEDLRAAARDRIEAALRGESVVGRNGNPFILLAHSAPSGLTDAARAVYFGRLAELENAGLTKQFRKAYGATIEAVGRADPARAVAFLERAWRETRDLAGQLALVELASFDAQVMGGVAPTFAASDVDEVRTATYRFLARTNRTSDVVRALPRLAEDLAANGDLGDSAFRIAQGTSSANLEAGARAYWDRAGDESALIFLVECGGERTVGDLVRALRSQNIAVVGRAASFLAYLQGAAAADTFVEWIEATGDSSSFVSMFDQRLLQQHGLPTPVLSEFAMKLPERLLTAPLIDVLVTRVDARALERVTTVGLKSDDVETLRAASDAARSGAFESALPALAKLLDSPNESLRLHASDAVNAIQLRLRNRQHQSLIAEGGAARTLERARALVRDDDPIRRRGGALALGALGDPAAIPLLLDLLDDEDAAVRDAALRALEKLGGGEGGDG